MPLKIAGRVLYNMEELSEATGVPALTWRRWCREGRIPAMKVGRRWVITETNLQHFFDGKKQGTQWEKRNIKCR